MKRRTSSHRGFNLVEMLIALSITSALLTATLVALNASFFAYQRTTEEASTHTISRLVMHRMLTLIRTGKSFAPAPEDPFVTVIRSEVIDFENPWGEVVTLRWDEQEEKLYVSINNGEEHLLLEDVMRQVYPDDYIDADGTPLGGTTIYPFTLEYDRGIHLYRCTIDMSVKPDDNMSVELDGANENLIRLVASAMPRMATY